MDEDYYDDIDDRFLEENREPCAKCGRETAYEHCGRCGVDLCPMCFECGGGFCGHCFGGPPV